MKLVIQIEDATLEAAISKQLGSTIADLTSARIEAEVSRILAIKFDRVTDAQIEKAIGNAAAQFIKGNGNTYDIERRVKDALASAAKEAIREASRKL